MKPYNPVNSGWPTGAEVMAQQIEKDGGAKPAAKVETAPTPEAEAEPKPEAEVVSIRKPRVRKAPK